MAHGGGLRAIGRSACCRRQAHLTPDKVNLIACKLLTASVLAFTSHTLAQMPTAPSGEPSAPDQWLLSNGREWHHKTGVSPTPLELKASAPTNPEAALIKRAQDILQNSSTKFMALMDGSDLVWSAAKTPLPENRRLFSMSMSMGKTVTSLAVGAAICDKKSL